jgi:hypothetical protein
VLTGRYSRLRTDIPSKKITSVEQVLCFQDFSSTAALNMWALQRENWSKKLFVLFFLSRFFDQFSLLNMLLAIGGLRNMIVGVIPCDALWILLFWLGLGCPLPNVSVFHIHTKFWGT